MGHTPACVGGAWEGSWGRTRREPEAMATSWQAASASAGQRERVVGMAKP